MSSNPLSNMSTLTPTSGVPAPAGPSRFKPVDPLALLRRHVLLLVVTLVIGVGLGIGTHYLLREYFPQFTSVAQYNIYRPASQSVGLQPNDADPAEAASFIEEQASWIRSPEILDQFLQTPTVMASKWFLNKHKSDFSAARDDLRENMLSISSVPRSSLMQIRFSSGYPLETQPLLRELNDVYLREARRASEGVNTVMRADALRRWEDAQEAVRDFEDQLKNRMSTLDVGGPEGEGMTYQAAINSRNLARSELLQAVSRLEQLRALAAAGSAEPTPEEAMQIESMQGDLPSRIASTRNYIDELTNVQNKGENHPEVRAANASLARLLDQQKQRSANLIDQVRAFRLSEAEARVRDLQSLLASWDEQVRQAEAAVNDYNQKKAQVAEVQFRLDGAKRRFAEADARLRDADDIRKHPYAARVEPLISASEAQLTFPQMSRVVPLVTLLTLGLMTGVLFLREMLDQRVRSPQDVGLIPDVELLGMLPHASEDPSGTTPVERVVERHPSGLMAESYRQVRAAVLVKMDRRGYRTLLLAGTQPEVGTSVVTHNLASSLAHQGRKVVVVDANFRRPAQHKLLAVPGEVGLVDVLHHTVSLRDALQRVEGMSLWVLPVGNATAAAPELLEHHGFRDILAELEGSFDVVLIDAAPALLTSEARLLAKYVDAVAVVVQAGRDARGMVQRTLKRLDGQRADVLGVILNGVRAARGGYYRKSYREFYRYDRGSDDSTGGERAPVSVPVAAGVGNGDDFEHGNGNGRAPRPEHGSNGRPLDLDR